VPFLVFEQLRAALADFDNFWHTASSASWRNLTWMSVL